MFSCFLQVDNKINKTKCSSKPNIVTHRLGLEAKVNLYTPSSFTHQGTFSGQNHYGSPSSKVDNTQMEHLILTLVMSS